MQATSDESFPRAETVSVVIPTRNRPAMVLAAVRSALAQTHGPLEVIVVVDGPETALAGERTTDVLSAVGDPRLRLLALPVSVGGGEARNVGVRAAAGGWIAFLDDDDLWLPTKLAMQLACARTQAAATIPVLSCPVLARSPYWEEVWPRYSYRAGQSMAEYLFCRRSWRYGDALLQTSTLLAPRSLLLRLPFTAGLVKHQDWDWLLRVAELPEVAVVSAGSEPLVVFHVEGERSSVGRTRNWRFSLAWACERRACFTRRAFAAFIATECAAQAAGEPWRERAALTWTFLWAAPWSGSAWLRFGIFLLFPQNIRRRLRKLLHHPTQKRRTASVATC